MDGLTSPIEPRRWHAGRIVFDERSEMLTIDGDVAPIEPLPRRLLHRLLREGGEVVPKEVLIAAAWRSTRALSDASFYNAMNRLRTALGETGSELVRLEPGRGYRIAADVTAEPSPAPMRPVLDLSAGAMVPGRIHWRLCEALGKAERRDVWLAVHDQTGERRVFKFAEDDERRDALRSELLCSRRLREVAAVQDGFVSVLDCALDHRPAYIESEYGGRDLGRWTSARGGLAALPLATRIELVARAATVLGAAHDVGVLHGDLTPGNILIEEEQGELRVSLIDFEVGGFGDPPWLGSLSVSLQKFAAQAASRQSGTLPYIAPERLADGRPTIAADIYALGVLLYQVIAGDLGRPLTAGWEHDIDDPHLREDIAEAAAGDPTRRLASARLLGERLNDLPSRRIARAWQQQEQDRAERLRGAAAARRRRRPWVASSAAALLVGTAAMGIGLYRATRERAEALHQSEIARSVDQFLTEDLLGRGNPAISGSPNETLMQAAQAAEPMIDQRLSGQPLLAANLYLALAAAFQGRREIGPAREAYRRSVAAFRRAEGPDGPDVVIVSLRSAILEVQAVEPGSIETARRLLAEYEPRVSDLKERRVEAEAWALAARATIQIGGGDMKAALNDFIDATRIADSLPTAFDPAIRFWLHDRQGYSLMKLGRWREARTVFASLALEQGSLHGPMHPNTLEARLHLAEVDSLSDKPEAAVSQIDEVYPAMETVFGPNHKMSLLALDVRATALMALGRYDEVVRDDMTVHDRAAATQGPESFYAFATLGHAGDADCRAGRNAAGTDKVERALSISERTLGHDSPVTQSGRVTLASCRVLAGHGDAAVPLLEHIDCHVLGTFLAYPGLCTDMALLRGVAEMQAGDRERGRLRLLSALGTTAKPEGDPFFARLARHTLDAFAAGQGAMTNDVSAPKLAGGPREIRP